MLIEIHDWSNAGRSAFSGSSTPKKNDGNASNAAKDNTGKEKVLNVTKAAKSWINANNSANGNSNKSVNSASRVAKRCTERGESKKENGAKSFSNANKAACRKSHKYANYASSNAKLHSEESGEVVITKKIKKKVEGTTLISLVKIGLSLSKGAKEVSTCSWRNSPRDLSFCVDSKITVWPFLKLSLTRSRSLLMQILKQFPLLLAGEGKSHFYMRIAKNRMIFRKET